MYHYFLTVSKEASFVDYSEWEVSTAKRHAFQEYKKVERQQGADRHWSGEEGSKPDNTSPLADWSPSPPAFQVAFSGNIKAFPH